MQVLILVVQNTSSFADLGVATSGVTFFRTIGSSFGAAIFGSLFANFLAGGIGPALAAAGAPPRAAESPQALHALSPEMAAPIVDAYADSLGKVFLCAVPVAVIGFIVSLFLKEVRLRDVETVSATDIGEGFGMPSSESPEKILEVAIGRLFRDSPEIRLRSLARQPGCELDVTQMWALLQIYRQNQVFGSATLTEIAERLRVPHEVIEPTFDGLVGRGLRTADRRAAMAHPGGDEGGRCHLRVRSSAASSRSWPRPRRSRAARTGVKWRPRWSASRTGCWCNGTGRMTAAY